MDRRTRRLSWSSHQRRGFSWAGRLHSGGHDGRPGGPCRMARVSDSSARAGVTGVVACPNAPRSPTAPWGHTDLRLTGRPVPPDLPGGTGAGPRSRHQRAVAVAVGIPSGEQAGHAGRVPVLTWMPILGRASVVRCVRSESTWYRTASTCTARRCPRGRYRSTTVVAVPGAPTSRRTGRSAGERTWAARIPGVGSPPAMARPSVGLVEVADGNP